MAKLILERYADRIDDMKQAREIAEKLSAKLLDTDTFIVEFFGEESLNKDEADIEPSVIFRFAIMRRHPEYGSYKITTILTLDFINDVDNIAEYVADSVNTNYNSAITQREKEYYL